MPNGTERKPGEPRLDAMAPDNLPYQLFLLVQQMTRRFQEVLAPHDLTPLHWGILCCLWRRDGLRPSEIAQELEQLGGTITVGLTAMGKRQLIRRRADPADGRMAQIYLTERGRDLETMLVPQARALIQQVFTPLEPIQYLQLQQQIALLRAHLSQPLQG